LWCGTTVLRKSHDNDLFTVLSHFTLFFSLSFPFASDSNKPSSPPKAQAISTALSATAPIATK
jgi:hypothetical protein